MAERIQKLTSKSGAISYRCRVEFPPDPATGQRVQRSRVFKSKKEAEKALTQWLAEIQQGTAIDAERLTVAALFDRWLAYFTGTNPKDRTLVGYQRTVRTKILPHIGQLEVQQLRPATIDSLYARLREAGESADAILRVHKRLGQALGYAVKRQLIAVSPLAAVDAPTVRTSPAVILTVPQLHRFVAAAAGTGYDPLWLLLASTGLRRGEALGLRWQDIDLARGRLNVRQTVEVLDGRISISTPKTAAALRSVTLFAETIAALAAHRKRQLAQRLAAGPAWQDNDLVFATPTGGPVSPDNALRSLRRLIARANAAPGVPDAARLPSFHIHDLRHTHATHLLMDGWSVAIVSRRLGHANPAITLRIYAHALTDVPGDDVQTPGAFAFAATGS